MEQTEVDRARICDIRGQICPSSLLISLRHINEAGRDLKAGLSELHILTDNKAAVQTISVSVRRMGFAVRVVTEDGYQCLIVSAKQQESV